MKFWDAVEEVARAETLAYRSEGSNGNLVLSAGISLEEWQEYIRTFLEVLRADLREKVSKGQTENLTAELVQDVFIRGVLVGQAMKEEDRDYSNAK